MNFAYLSIWMFGGLKVWLFDCMGKLRKIEQVGVVLFFKKSIPFFFFS